MCNVIGWVCNILWGNLWNFFNSCEKSFVVIVLLGLIVVVFRYVSDEGVVCLGVGWGVCVYWEGGGVC